MNIEWAAQLSKRDLGHPPRQRRPPMDAEAMSPGGTAQDPAGRQPSPLDAKVPQRGASAIEFGRLLCKAKTKYILSPARTVEG
jgi:hypothetical protein